MKNKVIANNSRTLFNKHSHGFQQIRSYNYGCVPFLACPLSEDCYDTEKATCYGRNNVKRELSELQTNQNNGQNASV